MSLNLYKPNINPNPAYLPNLKCNSKLIKALAITYFLTWIKSYFTSGCQYTASVILRWEPRRIVASFEKCILKSLLVSFIIMYLMHADFVNLNEYSVFLCKKYIEITVYYDLISVCNSFVPRWSFLCFQSLIVI